MTSRKPTTRKGFTLIELLTVIAIIGILASILIPVVGSVILTAKHTAAGANARSIANVYVAYSTSGSNSRTIATPEMNGGNANAGVAKDIDDVAFILAKNNQFNDASMWFIKGDDNLIGASVPKVVVEGDISTQQAPSAAFIAAKPKGWAFVTGMPNSAPSTTTPLLWSYGLLHDGTWDKINSPWKGVGGHIAYVDGHVDWVDRALSTTAQNGSYFVSYTTNPDGGGKPTVDWAQAINQAGKACKVVNEMGKD